MAGAGVCGGIVKGKRHEDLPSGAKRGEQGDGVFRESLSEENKNLACREAKASAADKTETPEHGLPLNIIKHILNYDSDQINPRLSYITHS